MNLTDSGVGAVLPAGCEPARDALAVADAAAGAAEAEGAAVAVLAAVAAGRFSNGRPVMVGGASSDMAAAAGSSASGSSRLSPNPSSDSGGTNFRLDCAYTGLAMGSDDAASA